LRDGFRYRLPPEVRKTGLYFASEKIPIHRGSVRERILKELNYLLLDRRSRVRIWLHRAHKYSSVILRIFERYNLPKEYIYLAAIESSYDSRALSSAGAYGFWQFMKGTAKKGPAGAKEYDWALRMDSWRDERADLIMSTHSAARYLGYMQRVRPVRIEGRRDREGFGDWLLTTAAYNAGPARVIQRMTEYGTRSYWDTPLPRETEKYVPRWIALGLISKYRRHYGLNMDLPDKITYDRIHKLKLRKDLSIATIARILDITPRQVWFLNTQAHWDKGVFESGGRRRPIEHTIQAPRGMKKRLLEGLKKEGYIK
jgi:membrane-bound lytic murein transglycosylase D